MPGKGQLLASDCQPALVVTTVLCTATCRPTHVAMGCAPVQLFALVPSSLSCPSLPLGEGSEPAPRRRPRDQAGHQRRQRLDLRRAARLDSDARRVLGSLDCTLASGSSHRHLGTSQARRRCTCSPSHSAAGRGLGGSRSRGRDQWSWRRGRQHRGCMWKGLDLKLQS